MNTRKPHPESPSPIRKRKNRARPTPKWLVTQKDLDEIARRRCVMILTVLSGVEPVTDVIEREKISRPLYYQLETKAVRAMLGVLTPGAEPDGRGAGMTKQIALLETKVKRLEQEKRRAERLLFLTKQVIKGPVTMRPTRRRKASSTTNGKGPSPLSTKASPHAQASTPSAAGAGAR
jgi:hypothetical protein